MNEENIFFSISAWLWCLLILHVWKRKKLCTVCPSYFTLLLLPSLAIHPCYPFVTFSPFKWIMRKLCLFRRSLFPSCLTPHIRILRRKKKYYDARISRLVSIYRVMVNVLVARSELFMTKVLLKHRIGMWRTDGTLSGHNNCWSVFCFCFFIFRFVPYFICFRSSSCYLHLSCRLFVFHERDLLYFYLLLNLFATLNYYALPRMWSYLGPC